MRYYTVPLYNVQYTDYYDAQALYVDNIIVKKGLFFATEILTERKIDIIPRKGRDKFRVIAPAYQKKEEFEKTGYHLTIFEEDFKTENLTTVDEIDNYVWKYDDSEYSHIHETIKEKNGQNANTKPPTIKQKIRRVRGTQK